MNLIGMSLDGDDEPEHVRVRRVRTRSASTPGFGVAAVMRALAVIIEGVKQLVYKKLRENGLTECGLSFS